MRAAALVYLSVTGCNPKPRPQTIDVITIPNVSLLSTDAHIEVRGGMLLYSGKPFSGHLLTYFSATDTAAIHSYYNGKEEGISHEWYTNHQLKEERSYSLGKKTGMHTGWWPNGTKRFEYHFANDIYSGEVKEWYPHGKPYLVKHYLNGQENGLQTIYYADGRLQANYEAKDGRNYGNTGYRNCESPRKQAIVTAAR